MNARRLYCSHILSARTLTILHRQLDGSVFEIPTEVEMERVGPQLEGLMESIASAEE